MRELDGEYEEHSNGKIISLKGRETGPILVAGTGQCPLKVVPLTVVSVCPG